MDVDTHYGSISLASDEVFINSKTRTVTLALLVLLKFTVTTINFAIGLTSGLHDAVCLFQRRALLLPSLPAIYVLLPIVTVPRVEMLPPVAGTVVRRRLPRIAA